jgi:hypothetical protein
LEPHLEREQFVHPLEVFLRNRQLKLRERIPAVGDDVSIRHLPKDFPFLKGLQHLLRRLRRDREGERAIGREEDEVTGFISLLVGRAVAEDADDREHFSQRSGDGSAGLVDSFVAGADVLSLADLSAVPLLPVAIGVAA